MSACTSRGGSPRRVVAFSIGANCFARPDRLSPRIGVVAGLKSRRSGIFALCVLLHTSGGSEEPGYRRGYAMAGVAIAMIRIVEIIATALLS
ncbi:hypothetical protein [Bradyrhizobium liaoningense]|uniref:hypothetical protein n=1 Tax=Bradyrhizobium liaoningense TaxID=43992 RepID=UPI001BAD2798|nr:hypothetical protein [Bradyrhizobium liaoningense]MBR0857656.1 hypothetical protein [Bradyrhizobium liaoningense]